MKPVSRQLIGKHIPAATNAHATMELLLETVFSTRSVQRGYKEDNPCGGGVEYLHRDLASRKRRRKREVSNQRQ
jgi:hypothetical protein